MYKQFKDRSEAGKELAKALLEYKNQKDVLLLALPRGGVPVAFEVSKALALPLDVLLVRKLGVPWHEELAMGAIAGEGISFINQEIIDQLEISKSDLEKVIAKEKEELTRRNILYRNNRPHPQITGKTIIVIDDGLATGATMHAAVAALNEANAARIIVAVPVGAPSTCNELLTDIDEIICLYQPEPFYAVGQWYQEFDQTTDTQVQQLLQDSNN